MFVLGFSAILHPVPILMIALGVLVGIIFGSIPGLTGTMAIAMLLPLTFSMSAIDSLSLLMGLYIGAASGGLISAILLRIPGTASSIATTFDGYPMAQKGEAGKALGVAIVASFLGGFVSFILLFFLAPITADIAVKFGPFEYFALTFFALTLISTISGDTPTKGLIAGLIGMALSIVGISPMDGFPRFTFGIGELSNGLSLLPALVGLFAISELLKVVKQGDKGGNGPVAQYKIKGFGFKFSDVKNQGGNFVRSSLIGSFVGILPGLGGSTANILSYISAKNASKHPEKFGTGIVDGIIASEASNNAAVGGALIPLLTLGIPGDTFTALLIGAFMIHGITPGPLLFSTNASIVYALFAALIVANIFMIIFEYGGMRFFVKLLQIPKHYLFPVIIVLCIVGSFGLNNRIFDAWTILLFGVIGYVLSRANYPLAPVILGFILGPMVELYFRRSLQMSEGAFLPFLQKPFSAFFIILSILVIVFSIIKNINSKKRKLS